MKIRSKPRVCGSSVFTLTESHFDLNTLAKLRSFLDKKSCTIASKNCVFGAAGSILVDKKNPRFLKAMKSIQLPAFGFFNYAHYLINKRLWYRQQERTKKREHAYSVRNEVGRRQ